ncbi:zinc metalloprotease [Anopheles sinensis]|uniref:Zinc metalloprotease n=1 Tax=Anopheles sinensis TaxID=74873 RepID=A0A084WMS4_ANOSI|nr:zinc metalloprotease [Anopheles sinensis]
MVPTMRGWHIGRCKITDHKPSPPDSQPKPPISTPKRRPPSRVPNFPFAQITRYDECGTNSLMTAGSGKEGKEGPLVQPGAPSAPSAPTPNEFCRKGGKGARSWGARARHLSGKTGPWFDPRFVV